MSDLIDRNMAITHVNAVLFPKINTAKEAEKALRQLPTIDAVPVRHGEWYGEADGYADGELVYDMWYCPFCGKRFEEWDEKPNWNYCPNCGARMEGHDETD